jgi:hypothetical protein
LLLLLSLSVTIRGSVITAVCGIRLTQSLACLVFSRAFLSLGRVYSWASKHLPFLILREPFLFPAQTTQGVIDFGTIQGDSMARALIEIVNPNPVDVSQ